MLGPNMQKELQISFLTNAWCKGHYGPEDDAATHKLQNI